MPNEVKKNEDGTVEVRLDTGEVFKGDPIEVMNKMGDSYVSGKRWTQNIKAENENLKAQRLEPPPAPVQQQPVNQDEAALRNYLLDQHAQALGFKNGDEYKQELTRIKSTTEQQENNQVAESFMLARPEFPCTQDAIDKVVARIEQNGWRYDVPAMKAAHDDLIREGAYKPLSPDEVNATWAQNMQQASGTRTPPPAPPANNPDGTQNNVDPWQMSKDELTKQMLTNGGLGRALMNLKPGETFGG